MTKDKEEKGSQDMLREIKEKDMTANGAPPEKISKSEDISSMISYEISSFEGFVFDKYLARYPNTKSAAILGHFEDHADERVIVKLERSAFDDDDISKILSSGGQCAPEILNDIYAQYNVISTLTADRIKGIVVRNATDKHIDKYTKKTVHIVEETPDDYLNVTLPFLEQNKFSIKWVYNILEHKQESKRIVFEDTDPEKGFILLPDLKWDGKVQDDLYLVAIVHQHGIKSVRDLNATHLPLLENIYKKGTAQIFEKYSLPKSQLKVFLHYYPSYYHLHVHFVSVNRDGVDGLFLNRMMLADVIDNIKTFGSDFYQRKTLTLNLNENHPLFAGLSKR